MVFHWPPSEIDELTLDDLRYWLARLEELRDARWS
jgi:hypothetical protein